MGIGLYIQIVNFMKSILCGLLFFVLYDVFRILRTFLRFGTVSVFIQDFLYLFLVFVGTFLFVFAINDGALRIYILCGILCGWLLGFFTYGKVSRFVIKKSKKE